MSPDLIIHVVGSKADLAPTLRQVDLREAQRAVASWMLDDSSAGDDELSMRGLEPTRRRDVSPPSPTRPRIYSRRGSLVPGSSASVPTITTSPPPSVESLGARVRTLSSKLGQRPTLTPTVSSGPIAGLNTSAGSSVNDLNVFTSSAGSATPSSEVPGSGASTSSAGLVKSASKFSLSFSNYGTDRSRKSADEERREAEDAERARLDELVERSGVSVSEVSAKDDSGECRRV